MQLVIGAVPGPTVKDAGGFRCIAADPPWLEQGGGGRGAQEHYPLLSTPAIIETMLRAPCWTPAPSCHLWLWVTNNFLPDGLHVMQALGFRYVSNMAWAKDKVGLGQYLRGQHELVLFGVRGQLPAQAPVPSLLVAPRRAHSQKPPEAFERFEAVSPGPRLEMFARERRSGWEPWGNELAA
ncbi:N6-adenosine-specific RNA methylase IME4 [Nannocystis exedens]|uniref:N6-adenosine-specific RNA methylase IME4 n=1 Tax=Nannocystis exedens TaxID=54 RepID=A0A1I2IJ06_9BACT|nr:MT-A70 family methyltransferase [Nannocystis exedens]PCC73126.1 hypothetical protein NAEX_06214 [Nannocystis exedens]SFF41628.1 N6-adenosine-specific RNA methylase IME4 [Nannocystis exedens]